jgi:long-chain acyl-CoA synthetase
MEKPWLKHYDMGVKPEIDFGTIGSINDIFLSSSSKYASNPAFSNMGKTLSYQELKEYSQHFAAYLQNSLGLKKGDRVALMMPNILQYPVALFGILQAGLVAVNVNPLYTARELEHQLNDSGAKAIVIFSNSAHVLDKVVARTQIEHIIVTDIGDLLGFPKSLIVNFVLRYIKKMIPKFSLNGCVYFNQVLLQGAQMQFTPVDCTLDDIAFLQYTGGTTGISKGAILTHKNIVANVLQAKEWISDFIRDGKEIIITPLPLYHIFSLTANCLIFFSVGGLNVLITNPRDIPGFVKELKKWKFTAFTGVNTLFNALLNNKDFRELDFSSLHVTLGGGMAVQEAVADEWKKVTKKPLIEAYGLTETSPAACINPMTLKDYNGFIGLPISSTIVSIKDDAGNDLPFGEVGEICIKGPQVMLGYWNRPDETAKVMTKDNYFRTGDLGYMNQDGFCKIVDRKKDMILVSGFNVYPNEIEDVVMKHPKILEAAAIGIPDEKSGEIVKLYVVPKDPNLTSAEVIEYCKQSLTAYKIPKVVEFRNELPKTNVGKILRKDLRAEAVSKTV